MHTPLPVWVKSCGSASSSACALRPQCSCKRTLQSRASKALECHKEPISLQFDHLIGGQAVSEPFEGKKDLSLRPSPRRCSDRRRSSLGMLLCALARLPFQNCVALY